MIIFGKLFSFIGKEHHPGVFRDPARFLDGWNLLFTERGHGAGSSTPCYFVAAVVEIGVDPVDPIGLLMKPVKAEFVLNPEHEQHTGGNTDGQSAYIDNGIEMIPEEVSEGDSYVIGEHVKFQVQG